MGPLGNRLDTRSEVWSEHHNDKLMDVQEEKDSAVEGASTLLINGINGNERHDPEDDVKSYDAADAVVTFPALTQKEIHACHRALPALTSKEPCLLSPPSPLRLSDAAEHIVSDRSAQAISLTTCATKGLSSWSLPSDNDKAPFSIMEPGAMSALTGDCLMQQSRTCLGCFIESKDGVDPEPGISLKMGDIHRDFDTCPVSDIGIHCMSTGDSLKYGDQLLSDQLLSFPVHKSQEVDKRDPERSDSDSEDTTQKNYYEGLLLDKCNGDEALLSNTNQEWGYFESFISESKIELLDLCSKNELSVNLFSEEDVDNYMFDDDDSTLGSDVCSLKIRYESFQDNVREKTNSLQEDAQFNFFPSVFTNCTKRENKSSRKGTTADPGHFKLEEGEIWEDEDEEENDEDENEEVKSSLSKTCGSMDVVQYISAKRSHFLDSVNSAEDSGEYSDDSSCSESSYDVLGDIKDCTRFLSREHSHSLIQPNYGLRVKRKVRYSDDYLYDVDSLENEKVVEKKEGIPDGPKEEDDDDWCPKKRRKVCRKEPPVIIKYIIINRFKGEKHMLVKLGKLDPSETTVNLSDEHMGKYQKLAPLKDYWEERRRNMSALCAKSNPDGSENPIPPRKRKGQLANRHRLQRIQTIEQPLSREMLSSYDRRQACSSKDDGCLTDLNSLALENASCINGLHLSDIAEVSSVKSRSLERELQGADRKVIRRIKFKSEARLKCKQIKLEQVDDITRDTADIFPTLENQDSVALLKEETIHVASDNSHPTQCHPDTDSKNSSFLQATCSPSKPVPSAHMSTNVPVLPGGYLQTLLDASDSSGSTVITYFAPHPLGQQSVNNIQTEKQFSSLQLAQSCVLSPPSESELQQSPHQLDMEQNFPDMWHDKPPSTQTEFIANLREVSIISGDFAGSADVSDADITASGYSKVNPNSSKHLYHKTYVQEGQIQQDESYQPCHYSGGEGCFTLQRGTLSTDNGRLISFDSVGSLSVSSSNYSSLSLKSCEKDGEDEISDDFLAHCSPKLVIQQSIDEITPLKESSDLLDISNFTPDKFRHSSLSEMSPPDTPNLSPQIAGTEGKSVANLKAFQNSTQVVLNGSEKAKWNCTVLPSHEQANNGFAMNNHQFQFHMFNDEDSVSVLEKGPCLPVFDDSMGPVHTNGKTSKSKKKSSASKNAGANQSSPPKTSKKKPPKASKGADKTQAKTPRQAGPKTSKKGKNANNDKIQSPGSQPDSLNNATPTNKALEDCMPHYGPSSSKAGKHIAGVNEWTLDKSNNGVWPDPRAGGANNILDDDQREFEEPSNILSNIASGMADVQRFMMASMEPFYNPVNHNSIPDIAMSPESNSLKLKTLKILAGTPQDFKKKVNGGSPGGSKKSTNKGSGKNTTKFGVFDPSCYGANLHSAFFDKNFGNLSILTNNVPTHKKLYRHKSTSKSLRDENCKGKRMDQTHKDPSVTAAFEKLR